jgi:hypothetical protein
MYTADHRCVTGAEREDVNGGVVASPMAYIHSVFIGSASDLILGGKGFVAEALLALRGVTSGDTDSSRGTGR